MGATTPKSGPAAISPRILLRDVPWAACKVPRDTAADDDSELALQPVASCFSRQFEEVETAIATRRAEPAILEYDLLRRGFENAGGDLDGTMSDVDGTRHSRDRRGLTRQKPLGAGIR